MEYKFYVKMDGQEFGPYSLAEIKELPLLPDTLVTESRLNGEWVTAETFDFEDLSHAVEEQEHLAHPTTEPVILSNWNWGAFSLSWIWSVCNGIYWPLVIIACNFIPYVGLFISFGLCVYLGFYGNRLAWEVAKEKEQTDANDFKLRQDKWNIIGVIILAIVIVSSIIGALLAYKYDLSLAAFWHIVYGG